MEIIIDRFEENSSNQDSYDYNYWDFTEDRDVPQNVKNELIERKNNLKSSNPKDYEVQN